MIHSVRYRPVASRQGFALVIVLIVISLLAVMGITLNRVGGMQAVLSSNRGNGEDAYYTSLAGVEYALFVLKHDPTQRGTIATGIPFGNGSYTVSVMDSPSPAGGILISSTGRVGRAVRTIEKRSVLPAYQATLSLLEDTYIDQGRATDNFGISTKLVVGAKKKEDAKRGLLKYDLKLIPPGSTIMSADLELYLYDHVRQMGMNNHLEIEVHRLVHSWKEGKKDGQGDETNWRRYAKNRDWTSRGGDFDPAVEAVTTVLYGEINQWHRWDITGLVQYWVNNPASNSGMILKDIDEGAAGKQDTFEGEFYSGEYVDASFRPKLTVIYTMP